MRKRLACFQVDKNTPVSSQSPTLTSRPGQSGRGRAGTLRGPVQGFVPSLDPYESQAPHYRTPESSQPTSPLPVHSVRHSARSRASGSLHNMIHGTLPFPAYSPPHTHPCWPCLVLRPTPSRRGCQPAAPGPAGLEMQCTWLPHLPNEIWFHLKSQSYHKKSYKVRITLLL